MAASIGVLHPGQMGAVVATSAKTAGNRVLWASDERRTQTRERASQAGLDDAGTVAALCGECEIVLSVCPPEFCEGVAQSVMDCGYRGIFVDANAIAPERVRSLGQKMEAAGVDFVDGGIIGLATLKPGATWLQLSGKSAARVAARFEGGPMVAEVLGEEIGRASAMKMCFASYSKGTVALMCAALATAEHHGVLQELLRQWDRIGPGAARAEQDIRRSAPKGWRYVPEMHEIAATYAAAGVPTGFHEAAAELYERLRECKDGTPTLAEVLKLLAR